MLFIRTSYCLLAMALCFIQVFFMDNDLSFSFFYFCFVLGIAFVTSMLTLIVKNLYVILIRKNYPIIYLF